MTRLILLVAALVAPSLSFAQGTILVRAGEHPNYSRLVIQISPDLPWEFRTSGRRAILSLPEQITKFDISEVFDRIPKTRILSLRSTNIGPDSQLVMTMGCPCSAQAQIQSNLLIIDVRDEEADDAQAADATEAPTTKPDAMVSLPPPRPMPPVLMDTPKTAPISDGPSPVETDISEAILEEMPKEQIAAEDVTHRLLEQLNRAAEQGLVELASPAEDIPMSPPEIEIPEPDPEPFLKTVEEDIDGLEAMADRFARELDASDIGNSVTVRVPETLTITKPGQAPEAFDEEDKEVATNENCIDPNLLDIRAWSDDRPAAIQISDLRGKIFGEFDAPDPDAALDLVRLYIAHGFGLEALALISDLEMSGQEAEILTELARMVEGQDYILAGHLDRAAGCGGNNDMWRAAALGATETLPLPDAESIIDYFSQTPTLVRRLIGPRIIESFLARDQMQEAKSIFAVLDRSTGQDTDAIRLARARLLHADGQIVDAEAAYADLVRSGGEKAVDAAILLTNSILARGARIPTLLVQDLEALSHIYRGSETGRHLRVTEISAKAGSDRLDAALEIVRQESRPAFEKNSDIALAANTILQSATVQKYGLSGLVSAIFEYEDIISDRAIVPETRLHLASQVNAAGLPNVAMNLLRQDQEAPADGSSILAARASLALDDPEKVLQLLQENETDDALRLRADALTKSGQYGAAYNEIAAMEEDPDLLDYAWRAGKWEAAIYNSRPEIQDFSEFMLRRSTPLAPDPDVLAEIGVVKPTENDLMIPPLEADPSSLTFARDLQQRSTAARTYLQAALDAF